MSVVKVIVTILLIIAMIGGIVGFARVIENGKGQTDKPTTEPDIPINPDENVVGVESVELPTEPIIF